jgi:pimeloyl-ACP methyl ester carboxylesterase
MKLYEAYQKFINDHEVLIFNHQTESIKYRFFGNGEQVILVLLGSSMFPTEAYFKILMELEKTNKVLTVEYPKSMKTVKELIKMISLLIPHLNIHKLNVLGASHGGGVAQAFSKAYPNLVNKLILYNTLTRTKQMNPSSNEVIQHVLEAIEQLAELRKMMPLETIKSALLDQIKDVIQDEETVDLFEHIIALYKEEDEKIQMGLIKDFLTHYLFEPKDFRYLENRVMVLYSNDDDPFGGAELIETLADLLTSPRLEFIEADRFSLILDSKEFSTKINQFIQII